MARTDPDPVAEPSDPAANQKPSPRVVAWVATVVGILALIVAVLRLLGVGAPPAPVDSDEALDEAAEVVQRQQAQDEVEAYVRANDPLISPSESVLATCTRQDEVTYSCSVLITGDGLRTETVTVRRGIDGRWSPVEP